MNLTPKQLRILQFLRDFRQRHGYSPTMQEIADELDVSKVTVFEHVEALIAKGALARNPNKARSLSIPRDVVVPSGAGRARDGSTGSRRGAAAKADSSGAEGSDSLAFPLVGRIAAGYPIEKFAQDDQLRLEEIFGPRRGQRGSMFALQVDGDSMRDEGILDGDYVIVERRNTARNGERVVALLPNGETTLKSFFREEDGMIRLQPANPEFAPIYVEDCSIQGVVTGVLRRY
jgi:repressor LexA